MLWFWISRCNGCTRSCRFTTVFCFHNSKSSGSAALLALSWTCLLVRTVFPSPDKRQGETWKKLVGSFWFVEIPFGDEDFSIVSSI